MPSRKNPIADLLRDLQKAFDRLGLRWYLFGAQAAVAAHPCDAFWIEKSQETAVKYDCLPMHQRASARQTAGEECALTG